MKCSEVHYSADESSAVEDSTEYCTLSEVQRVWFRECVPIAVWAYYYYCYSVAALHTTSWRLTACSQPSLTVCSQQPAANPLSAHLAGLAAAECGGEATV